MWFWLLFWFVLSFIIIGASVWSWMILFQQKKAWDAFAKKHGLSYTPGRLLGPASLEGYIEDYKISFFIGEKQAPDVRNRRYMTIVEMTFPEGLVGGGVAGTSEMLPFMQTLSQLKPFSMTSDEHWDKSHRVFARDQEVVRGFLTPRRVKHLNALLRTKKRGCAFDL